MTVLSQKRYCSLQRTGHVSQPCGSVYKSFRLMVGVPDYQTYLEHMKAHHPDLTPMDAQTFYRHCVDARYPSAGGTLKKCPC